MAPLSSCGLGATFIVTKTFAKSYAADVALRGWVTDAVVAIAKKEVEDFLAASAAQLAPDGMRGLCERAAEADDGLTLIRRPNAERHVGRRPIMSWHCCLGRDKLINVQAMISPILQYLELKLGLSSFFIDL